MPTDGYPSNLGAQAPARDYHDFFSWPDGQRRHIVGCKCLNGYEYRVGAQGILPAQAGAVSVDSRRIPELETVVRITSLGSTGHLRICFEGGQQIHVANAMEIWEPVESSAHRPRCQTCVHFDVSSLLSDKPVDVNASRCLVAGRDGIDMACRDWRPADNEPPCPTPT